MGDTVWACTLQTATTQPWTTKLGLDGSHLSLNQLPPPFLLAGPPTAFVPVSAFGVLGVCKPPQQILSHADFRLCRSTLAE